ncbi:hypothetical protein B0O99DRAFT_588976 [Bisporella sp. PMI_857]|nr:hypothetical protein B0O99DRAFT_588976 [Bisporella sp. PMI_857]
MEDDSYPLPKLTWHPSTESFSHDRPSKRVRLSPPLSSDPVLFSSDDDPSIDNYVGPGRRKRQFRGPWYQQKECGSQNVQVRNSRRKFERQYDSGVFLGSDCTDTEDAVEDDGQWRNPLGLSARQWNSRQPIVKQEATPEVLARKYIDICLEEGLEIIDLSSRNLTVLSNDTIRPLSTFTRNLTFAIDVFDELNPNLKIFLASNRLNYLPEELFNLERLTVLSIRDNDIYEIPPVIARLQNLNELNISQNKLQYLPYEILDLFSANCHLTGFQIHPNPFLEPHFPPEEEAGSDEEVEVIPVVQTQSRPRRGAIWPGLQNWHPEWKISYQARSEIRYLDFNGAHLQGPNFSRNTLFGPGTPTNGIPIAKCDDVPQPPNTRGYMVSRAPSLLEVALNACAQSSDLPNLSAMLPDLSPEYFPGLLAYASAKKESGDTICTMCKRKFIIPRTEWIEWWEIRKSIENQNMATAIAPFQEMVNERDVKERMVPLIRRGCSWLCTPAKTISEVDVAN